MQTLAFLWSKRAEIGAQTLEHLGLTLAALGLALTVGVTLGVALTRYRRAAPAVLGFVNVVQTVPSIALLGFMIPLLGIGVVPAVAALFLYALLP
ncbi:MAG: ABC transporter permease, partial [Catalinimonas sp.]